MIGRDPCTCGEITNCLHDARERTLGLVEDLSDDQMLAVPRLEILNPFLWEVGHVAWFQERWILRHLAGNASLIPGSDDLFDSSWVEHDTRWDLAFPTRADVLLYMRSVYESVLERLEHVELDEQELYFHRLVLYHEDMHTEALAYMRQTVGYPEPKCAEASAPAGGPHPGDAEIPGGSFRLGAERDAPFAFDNEQWGHEVEVRPFRLAKAPVTQAEYRAFVADGGYARSELWSDEGWRWRESEDATHPVYWRLEGDAWQRRHFDRWVPLEPHLPVSHVNWFEASAYCRWAGRRLPSEAEWEWAAGSGRHPWGDDDPTPDHAHLDLRCASCADVGTYPSGDSPHGLRQMTGNVWEWTASTFEPYPGFTPGPYRDYSEPWFGTRKVMRGGAYATRARMLRNTWRNYFTPDRCDVLAGFRTAASGE